MSFAFDRRRIPAPEDSHPPLFPAVEAGPSSRVDRSNDASRPIFLKTGLVTQANGSAYIEAHGVKIACSVFGPRPKPPPYSPQGSLNVEVKYAPFANRVRRAPLRDTEPVNTAALLTELLLPAIRLHLLPKLSVDVHLLVLEADCDAAVLSAGLTAACAAVADAGIELNGLAVGTVVAAKDDDETHLLDPTGEESTRAESVLTVGSLPALGTITSLHLVGETSIDGACKMVEMALDSSKTTHTVVAQALVEGASS